MNNLNIFKLNEIEDDVLFEKGKEIEKRLETLNSIYNNISSDDEHYDWVGETNDLLQERDAINKERAKRYKTIWG